MNDTSAPFAVKRISWHANAKVLTEAWLLGAFDRLSRSLAQQVSGEEGVLLGFDSLEVRDVHEALCCSVTVSATLLEERGSSHAVAYQAVVRQISHSRDERPSGVVVARAAGWTWTPSRGPLTAAVTPAVGLVESR